jgi:hypothetical protein
LGEDESVSKQKRGTEASKGVAKVQGGGAEKCVPWEGLGRTCNPWSVDQNPTCLKPPVHLPPRCEEFSTCEGERERETEERGVDPSKVQTRA